jgi:uncharacterized protein (TIGR03435 family)
MKPLSNRRVASVAMKKLQMFALMGVALTVPLHGQANADVPEKFREFEVASVKPNKTGGNFTRISTTQDGIRIENGSLLMLLKLAYGLSNSLDDKFLGLPPWSKTQKFDVEAKVSPADVDDFKKLTRTQRQPMMQALLADRFKLQAHRETKEEPVYLLLLAKGGSKLQESKPAEDKGSKEASGMMRVSRDQMEATGVPISQLISSLTQAAGRTVLDKTELAGKYDFTLHWTPDEEGGAMLRPADSGQPANETASASSGPSIFTAVQEQLGLKLEPGKGPVECLVIDHVEQPSEN